jgi:TolA-binding protein
VQILVDQKQLADARTTWDELAARYPAFAESKKGEALVRGLPAPPAAGGK